MSLSIGIVGLPNAGKSTLFNALLRQYQAKVADYPFTTIEPNVGIVEVPDERLDKIAAVLKLPKKIPATLKFIDIAGLVKNAHQGEGLGNQFLSHIREVDAIIHIIDAFSKDSQPEEAKEIIKTELELAEIHKPTIYVENIAEKDILANFKDENLPRRQAGLNYQKNENLIKIGAKIEMDLIELTEKEQKEYLATLGLKESGLVRLIKASYKLLNLISFYTLIPEKQVQAWPILKGTPSPKAAAKIHTDMEQGFIVAEVLKFDDLISTGGWSEAQQKGRLRTEGKDYLVQESDIIHFRFNV